MLEYRNSLLQLLLILGRNGRTPLLILELAQLMGKPFGKCEQVTLHLQNGFPFLI